MRRRSADMPVPGGFASSSDNADRASVSIGEVRGSNFHGLRPCPSRMLFATVAVLTILLASVPADAQLPETPRTPVEPQTTATDRHADSSSSPPASEVEPAGDPEAEQSSSSTPQADDATDADAVLTAAEQAEAERERRRQTAVAALLVLGSVCMVLLLMILSVIVWARRVRRMAAQQLPDQHPGDPLWYLRHARRPGSEHTTDTHR